MFVVLVILKKLLYIQFYPKVFQKSAPGYIKKKKKKKKNLK